MVTIKIEFQSSNILIMLMNTIRIDNIQILKIIINIL